jgi:hypothetical protein
MLSFCELHFRYGRGAGLYYRRRKRHSRQTFAGSLRFHASIPALVIRRWQGLSVSERVRLVSLLTAWLMLNAAGCGFETVRQWLTLMPVRSVEMASRDVASGK